MRPGRIRPEKDTLCQLHEQQRVARVSSNTGLRTGTSTRESLHTLGCQLGNAFSDLPLATMRPLPEEFPVPGRCSPTRLLSRRPALHAASPCGVTQRRLVLMPIHGATCSPEQSTRT